MKSPVSFLRRWLAVLAVLLLPYGAVLQAQVYNLHVGMRVTKASALVLGIETSLSRHGSLLGELGYVKADNSAGSGKGASLAVLYRHGFLQAFTGPYWESGLMGIFSHKNDYETDYSRWGVAALVGVGYSRLMSRHLSFDIGLRPGLMWQRTKTDYSPKDLYQDRIITTVRNLRLDLWDVHVSFNYLF